MLSIVGRTLIVAQEEHEEEHTTETEHAEEPTGLDLILPATPELVGGALAFAIVATLLIKKAFPKIREGLQAREDLIRGNLEAAEAAKAEGQTALAEYNKQIGDARAEGNRIIEDARTQAEEVRKGILDKAKEEAEGITARATEQIEAERTRTLQELQGTIAQLSIELAEKVVGRSLNDQSQREFVDAYIKEVAGMSRAGGLGQTPNGNGGGGA
jgi:F-type H+-transporting ATPase subunit b